MIVLSLQQISEISPNRGVFIRGQQYHQQGAVRELVFNEENSSYEALVEGTRQYSVKVRPNGVHSISALCSCDAFAHYDGFCKHIIAVLLALSGESSPEGAGTDADKQIDRLLDRYMGKFVGNESSTEVKLDLRVGIRNTHYRNSLPQFYTSLKIGESRQYVVRSVDRLISAIVRKEPLVFGKQFTYDPAGHHFSPIGRRIIDFFARIHEVENQSSRSGNSGLLRGKEVQLSEELFRRLLLESKGFPFTLEIDRRVFNNVTVTDSELPLQFSLKECAEGLLLKLRDKDIIRPLTRECDLVFHEDKIYFLPATPQKVLCPLLQAGQKGSGDALHIGKSRKQRFFSELYPFIEDVADITVSPSLSKRLFRPSLEAKVYLDYDNGEILAQLKFVYGEIIIDPFAPKGQPEKQKPDGQILIRNTAAEQQVMRLFEEAEFTIRSRTMRLSRDEDIWRFINEIIPNLQQRATVYYSDRFRLAHRKPPRFMGRVGIDWNLDLLDFKLELENVNPEELAEIWQSLRIKRKYHRLRDGSILPLEGAGIDHFASLTGALDLQPSALKNDTIRLPKYQALYLNELLSYYKINTVKESEELTGLVRRIRRPARADYRLPPQLENVLRDYQKIGFRWLKSLSSCGFGGILADDMGLGKTIQAIAFILSAFQESAPAAFQPALIVAPASLIYNWEAEIEKFAPQLKTLVVTGTKRVRQNLLAEADQADVVITSYPLLRRDSADYAALRFSSCFLDEAQYIKNPKSLTARSVQEINTRQRFALTGTPIENSLSELWSIFQFIMPGYLQSQKKFRQKFGDAGSSSSRKQCEDATAMLAAKVRPFILRRLKEEVLSDLPPKIEHNLLSELTKEQKKIYLTYLERIRDEAKSQIQNSGFNKSRIQILAGLTRLRQICCHPALFLENYRGKSAKLLQLLELLHETVNSGHRLLLFSQFTGMLQLIKNAIDRDGYRYFYLDGSVKTGDRLKLVNSFNEGDADIFLISLRAGGTGLNLTGADVVIQYDLWWNPAIEEQAAGRAHRIGQKKVVQVIRMLSKNTIEEKIYELQQKKKELIDRIIQPGETFLSAMSESDIREILEI